MKSICMVLCMISTMVAVGGNINDIPPAWIPAGNEKEEIFLKQTGRTIVYLTSGDSIDTQFHYHGGTWGSINGRTYLFFTSSRERPESAGETIPGERQIMAADVETGDLYYLTTISNEPFGGLRHMHSRPYYASYNDVAKTIFFFNKKRNQLFAYNCLTGEQKCLLSLPKNGASRELDDFVDAQSIRLIYPYTVRDGTGMPNYIAVSDFDRDLNLISNTILKECPDGEAFNHVEICPADKNLFFYQHKSEQRPNGSHAKIDVYLHNLLEGTDQLIKPDAEHIDHIVWGENRDYIYWDNNQCTNNLYAYNWRTETVEQFGHLYAGHNKLSSDESLWVYDTMEYGTPGKTPLFVGTNSNGATFENWIGSIWLYDRKSDLHTLYATILWAHPHPRHPHAVFSPDDSMISFVTGAAITNDNTRIAVMHVLE